MSCHTKSPFGLAFSPLYNSRLTRVGGWAAVSHNPITKPEPGTGYVGRFTLFVAISAFRGCWDVYTPTPNHRESIIVPQQIVLSVIVRFVDPNAIIL